MLKHYGYPDLGVVEELKAGASLTGDVTETGMLPFKFTPALLTDDALRVHSALRREQILAEPRGSGDPEVDKAVWDQTLVEKEQGWLRGPIPLENVPSNSPISRRFGLRQKHKIRLIDDFSESSVNATCQFLSHRSFTRLMSRVPQSCIGLLVPKLNTWTRVWLPEHSIFPALTAR